MAKEMDQQSVRFIFELDEPKRPLLKTSSSNILRKDGELVQSKEEKILPKKTENQNKTYLYENKVRRDSFLCGMATLNGLKMEIYNGSVLNADKLQTDCIVNAANNKLNHNGGLAYNISILAGENFERESAEYIKKYHSLKKCEAIHTTAGDLNYKCIIHVAGPIVRNSFLSFGKEDELRTCIFNSMNLADRLNLISIGIPGISCGIFGFPKKEAATCHLQAFEDFAKYKGISNSSLKCVRFFLFDDDELQCFTNEFLKRIEEDHYDYSFYIGTPISQAGSLVKYCGTCSMLYKYNYFTLDCHQVYCNFCVYRYQVKKCSVCNQDLKYQSAIYCRICSRPRNKHRGCCTKCNNICSNHSLTICSYCDNKIER